MGRDLVPWDAGLWPAHGRGVDNGRCPAACFGGGEEFSPSEDIRTAAWVLKEGSGAAYACGAFDGIALDMTATSSAVPASGPVGAHNVYLSGLLGRPAGPRRALTGSGRSRRRARAGPSRPGS